MATFDDMPWEIILHISETMYIFHQLALAVPSIGRRSLRYQEDLRVYYSMQMTTRLVRHSTSRSRYGILLTKNIDYDHCNVYNYIHWDMPGTLTCEYLPSGNLHGMYKITGQGECLTARYHDGRLVSPIIITRLADNQPLVSVSMSGRKRHGTYRRWFPNGELQLSMNYEHGQPHGLYQRWYRDPYLRGTFLRERWYDRGRSTNNIPRIN